MEQSAPPIQRSSLLKYAVALLGGLCVVALCFSLALQLIHYYQTVNMVKGLPARYSNIDDYSQLYAPNLSSVLAFNRKTDEGIIWDYASQRVTQHIAPAPAKWGILGWSPDKRYLLYMSENGLYLWDLAGQKKVFNVSESDNIDYQEAIWSPDHSRIALVYLGGLTIRDAATGKILVTYRIPEDDDTLLRTMAWSPDNKRIAAGFSNDEMAQVRILNASTLKTMSQVLQAETSSGDETYQNMHLVWSPDGTALAASFGQQVWLVNTTNGAKTRRLSDQYDKNWTTLAWSPDSKQLAVFRSHDDGYELAIWRVADFQKRVIYQSSVLGALNQPRALYWPPGSQRILLLTYFTWNQESLALSGW